ncbi:hypothetical protein CNY89_01795 [Amaricoccus sp. HAR-UPW-R2A-40]|nr:hypothetical protein CNY89_01795 [Amaricoccus sp. HAR-UPW-R2A-40]
MRSLHPSLFLLALLLNVAVIRLGSYLLPDRLYFSFSSFLFDNRDLVKPLALSIKLLTPFVAAFALTGVVMLLARGQSAAGAGKPGADLQAILTDQLPITLAYAAFFAALLMAWPYILLWDLLIDPAFARYRLLFLLAYFAYFTAYAFFALAGANTARALLTPDPGRPPLTWSTLTTHPLTQPLFNAVGGAVSAAVAAFLATRIGG